MSETMTFEQAMQRLETGKCPLDESMKLFDEGAKLVSFCSDTLKTAEQKIVQLTQTGIEE